MSGERNRESYDAATHHGMNLNLKKAMSNLVARWSSTTGRWSLTDNYGSAQLWPVGMLY
jgi:hypothetical protein